MSSNTHTPPLHYSTTVTTPTIFPKTIYVCSKCKDVANAACIARMCKKCCPGKCSIHGTGNYISNLCTCGKIAHTACTNSTKMCAKCCDSKSCRYHRFKTAQKKIDDDSSSGDEDEEKTKKKEKKGKGKRKGTRSLCSCGKIANQKCPLKQCWCCCTTPKCSEHKAWTHTSPPIPSNTVNSIVSKQFGTQSPSSSSSSSLIPKTSLLAQWRATYPAPIPAPTPAPTPAAIVPSTQVPPQPTQSAPVPPQPTVSGQQNINTGLGVSQSQRLAKFTYLQHFTTFYSNLHNVYTSHLILSRSPPTKDELTSKLTGLQNDPVTFDALGESIDQFTCKCCKKKRDMCRLILIENCHHVVCLHCLRLLVVLDITKKHPIMRCPECNELSYGFRKIKY